MPAIAFRIIRSIETPEKNYTIQRIRTMDETMNQEELDNILNHLQTTDLEDDDLEDDDLEDEVLEDDLEDDGLEDDLEDEDLEDEDLEYDDEYI